ncbi:hypothetical protein IEQ34_007741 [Dendrobium chrysotoxum]|uniref:Uncharacterized protein n=1 Tax=Dendrobium chrysotoxum TaxID=161865 RepID=A0AAV7H5S4_DENCH|nr:hypothetical protein IEQ34_007741 [Dendrobium chrysotoxum]
MINGCQVNYLLECAQGSQYRSSNPDTVLPFRWSHHFNFHAARCKSRDLLTHTISNTSEHGGSTTKHNVSIQVFPDIYITLHDRVICSLMDTSSLHTYERWLEKHLCTSEPLSANCDDLAIWKLIVLLN